MIKNIQKRIAQQKNEAIKKKKKKEQKKKDKLQKKKDKLTAKEQKLRLAYGDEVIEENLKYSINRKISEIEGKEIAKTILTFYGFAIAFATTLLFGFITFILSTDILKRIRELTLIVGVKLAVFILIFLAATTGAGTLAVAAYERNVIRYGKITAQITKVIIYSMLVYFLKDSPIGELVKSILS